jgi:hypothetical protein
MVNVMSLVKVKIKENCFVSGKLAKVDAVVEVEENDASHMVGNGRAEYYKEPAEEKVPEGPTK